MSAAIVFVLIELLLAVCLYLLPQLFFLWAVILAVCPLFLLLFWQKPTLPKSQNIFAIVFALQFGTLFVHCGNSFMCGIKIYEKYSTAFFTVFVGCLAIAAFFGFLLGNFTKRHYRMFVLGILLSIAHVCIPQNGAALWTVSFCLTLFAVMFSVASVTSMHNLIDEAASTLEVKDVSEQLLSRNIAFVATGVNLFFIFIAKFCAANTIKVLNLTSDIVCAVIGFTLLFIYLYQPLETISEYQMKLLKEKNPQIDCDGVREQLYHRLSEEKTYPFAAFLRKILPFFFHDKTVGLEKVTEPVAVFVANHYEIYGPFISELKFPRAVRPWTDSLMTNRSTITRQLRSGIDVVTKKWLIKPIRKRLPALAGSVVWNCINSCRPISIYRRNQEKIEKMLDESVAALKCGDSILVFPEKPPTGELYKDDSVDTFQTGFVEIAEKFKQSTNRDLTFYPLYIDKAGKKMVVGERVYFDSAAPLHDEKLRVANSLFEQMTQLANNCADERAKKRKNS